MNESEIKTLKIWLEQAKKVHDDLENYREKIVSSAPVRLCNDLTKKVNDTLLKGDASLNIKPIYSWEGANGCSGPYAEGIDVISKLSEIISVIKAMLPEDIAKKYAERKKHINIFLSHGRNEVPLLKMQRFIEALGLNPLVVKEEPSRGQSVGETVEEYMSKSKCVILLATAEQEIKGKWHTGENIINEEGLAKKYVGNNIIYLLEDKVSEIPSNFREKIYERFSNENMTDAFIKVAKELNAFGLI